MNKKTPVYVIGTGLSHDGSACLLKDGRVCAAIEKERITRIKHDGGNDRAAIEYLLAAECIKMRDVSLMVQNANFGMMKYDPGWFIGERAPMEDVPAITISHHLAHAYGAFATSPFEDAAVLIIDGCGNAFDDCMDLDGATVPDAPDSQSASLWYEKDSYYNFGNCAHSTVFKDFSPWGTMKGYPMHPPTTRHSIGGVYAAASKYVFNGLEDPGKLMGLAPYGRAGKFEHEVFDLRDGQVFVRYDWMDAFRMPSHSPSQFKSQFQHYADLAYGIQREVERAILYVAQARFAAAPSANLCYAGGVALNAVANRRLLKEGPYRNLYIQPAAADNGLAIGCAYYGWFKVLGGGKPPPRDAVYFGRLYETPEILATLIKYESLIEWTKADNVADETATHLAAGKVVGWFQGGAEFGPRALGNRSILADPRLPGVRDHINGKVKFREDFRPFAPAVIAEDCSTYFECDYASPHMLLTAPVRPAWRDVLPAIVHCDGSARIQTVDRKTNERFYDLLSFFKAKTAIGMLLNTSLNRRGTPIAETPEDAIMLFLYSAIDFLVLDEYVVRKPSDFTSRMAQFNKLVARDAPPRGERFSHQ
jgi:carbamoyltransferase